MMQRLRPLGIAMALVLGATGLTLAAGCTADGQMHVGTPTEKKEVTPPPAPPAPTDTDGDGIADKDDKCVGDKEDGLAPDPKDGCPSDDPDNDGIKGTADKCPNEAETVNDFEDEDGCPDKKPMVEIKGLDIKINDKIMFKENSAEIDEKSNTLIENIANVLKAHEDINIVEIAGHADKQGADAHNKTLTQNRAKSVMNALVKLGVDAKRMRAAGYSSYCPVDTADNEQAFEKNRRVEIKILRRDGKDTEVKWGGCEEAQKKGMKPAPLPAAKAPKAEKGAAAAPAAPKGDKAATPAAPKGDKAADKKGGAAAAPKGDKKGAK